MKQHFRDQRGVAMLMELVLVAAVFALVGVALYQSNHGAKTASLQSKAATPAPASAEGLATSAAAIAEQDATSDAALNVSAEATADELSNVDADVTNLGGTSDASF